MELDGYELFVTTDRNLKYQQNLSGRKIAILVLLSAAWPRIQLKVDEVAVTVAAMKSGDYVGVSF